MTISPGLKTKEIKRTFLTSLSMKFTTNKKIISNYCSLVLRDSSTWKVNRFNY